MSTVLPFLRNAILVSGLLLLTCSQGQSQDNLPNDFNALIQQKTQLLEQYSKLQESGPPDQAVQVLRQIVNIHRRALSVAEAEGRPEDILSQLRRVFGNDTEYLSDELFARGEYAESAALRKEVETFYQKLLGPQHNAVQAMHWKAVTAEKLSNATNDQQVAYAVATGAEEQARRAMQNGQLDIAARVFTQLIEAQIAVLGEAHPDVAVDLNEYGRVLWMQQKYDEAEKAYQRSLKARESTTGKDLQFATTSFNLGRLYQDTQKPADAEQYYLAAAAIEEPILGSTNESFLQTLNQLATLYEQTGDRQKLADIQQRIAAADPLATITSHLPKGTYAGAALQPARLIDDPALQLLPFEVIEAAGREEMGFNPLDIEAAVVFATLPVVEPPFNFGLLFKLKDGAPAEFPWAAEMETVEFGQQQTYLRKASGGQNTMAFAQFNDGVVLLGTEETIRQSLTRSGDTVVGSILKADRDQGQLTAAANLTLIQPFIQAALADAPPLPPALDALKSTSLSTETVKVWVDVTQGLKLSLILNTTNEETAGQTSEAITNALNFGLQMALQEMESELEGDKPVEVATRAYAQRIVRQYLNKLQPTVAGRSVIVEVEAMEQSFAPISIALLLPAVQAAREAARRTQDLNSLKQIAVGMHIYHDTHGHFPTRASYDSNEKPLLSWRVHLLPFLDQQELYDQFHLDEPWDSPHNIELAAQMPDVYRSQSAADGMKTLFMTLDGKGTLMEGTKGLTFADITDGASNTMMIVQADEENAVVWTQPEDLKFDPESPWNGLGGLRPTGFLAAFADGSCRLVPIETDEETLRRLILRNDGQPVDF
ncbi:MAG: DUF1559 domain-containing protein [Fuerstiella sp.]